MNFILFQNSLSILFDWLATIFVLRKLFFNKNHLKGFDKLETGLVYVWVLLHQNCK